MAFRSAEEEALLALQSQRPQQPAQPKMGVAGVLVDDEPAPKMGIAGPIVEDSPSDTTGTTEAPPVSGETVKPPKNTVERRVPFTNIKMDIPKGIAGVNDTIYNLTLRPFEESPGASAAGIASGLAMTNPYTTAGMMFAGALSDKVVKPLVDRFTDSDPENNQVTMPKIGLGDAAEVGLQTGLGFAFPGNNVLPWMKSAPALTPPAAKQAAGAVIPKQAGTGYKEAVEAGAKQADVTLTPGQKGSSAGQAVEEVIAASPSGASMKDKFTASQRQAYENAREAFFGAERTPEQTGANVRTAFSEATKRINDTFDGLFKGVRASAQDNAQNSVEANTIIKGGVERLKADFNLTDDLLNNPDVLPYAPEVVRAIRTAEKIGSPDNANGLVYDYATVDLFRRKLGVMIGEAQKFGDKETALLLGQLRESVTDAQALFLPTAQREKWSAIKAAYSDYQNAIGDLSGVFRKGTSDGNIPKLMVGTDGTKRMGALTKVLNEEPIDAALRTDALETAQHPIVEDIRKTYLQGLVENSRTLTEFDAAMKKLGPTQRQYFNDDVTARARGLVALNQAIKGLEQGNQKASRPTLINALGAGALTMAGPTLLQGAGVTGAPAMAAGLGAYALHGYISAPLYMAAVQIARSADQNIPAEAKQTAMTIVKEYVKVQGRQKAAELPGLLPQMSQNPPEQRQ